MFWTVLLLSGLAATFSQLGAASVTISVLATALQVAVVAIAALIGLLVCQKYGKDNYCQQD